VLTRDGKRARFDERVYDVDATHRHRRFMLDDYVGGDVESSYIILRWQRLIVKGRLYLAFIP
jgi:hypothetical protein